MPIPVEYIFLEVPNCRKAMTSEASQKASNKAGRDEPL